MKNEGRFTKKVLFASQVSAKNDAITRYARQLIKTADITCIVALLVIMQYRTCVLL